MRKTDKTIIRTVISANLEGLAERLTEMAQLAKDASHVMKQGEQNFAIGTVLEFERLIPEIEALFKTALLMHRNSI